MKSFYEAHCENLRMINQAIRTVQRTLRDYISKEEDKNVDVYTKILSHLINTWAEVRILKLIYENSTFSDDEKQQIINANGLNERWKMALTIAFCKAYIIPNHSKIDLASYTPRMRYKILIKLIDSDLLRSSQLRNRLSHGQWKYAFNNDLSDINATLTRELRKENIVTLQSKLKLFKSLSQIIHDLAVSKPTFERDFDKNFKVVEEQKRNYHNRSYNKYGKNMIEKRKRGLSRRRKSMT